MQFATGAHFTAAMLLVAGWLSYYAVNRFICPGCADGDQTEQITFTIWSAGCRVVNPDDEFGRLAQRFNNLLDRLEYLFLATAAIIKRYSDELKTPVRCGSAGKTRIADGHFNDETQKRNWQRMWKN